METDSFSEHGGKTGGKTHRSEVSGKGGIMAPKELRREKGYRGN